MSQAHAQALEEAKNYLHSLLKAMATSGGSDLFISNDFAPKYESTWNYESSF